jgi:hypothetical protein
MSLTPPTYHQVGLISVDPGVRVHAVALWEDGLLRGCAMPTSPRADAPDLATVTRSAADAVVRWLRGYCGGEALVVEFPRAYEVQAQKGDQNDLLALACSAGVLMGTLALPFTRIVTPQEWKGQTPKDVVTGRALHALSDVERAALRRGLDQVPTPLHHNIHDAVAIGLWALDRLHTRRTPT